MDIQKAVNYVQENGNSLELARLRNIFDKEIDSEPIVKGFLEMQNPDGGFPFADKKGFPSCVSNTTMALHTLLELNLEKTEPAKKIIEFFRGKQEEDGSWQEHDKIAPLDPPAWDMPRDDRTTLWLTADITDLFLRMGIEINNSGDFIKEHQSPDGKFMGFMHTNWMALSIYGKNGLNNKQVFTNTLTYLESIEVDDLDAVCLAWFLDCMKFGEVPKSSILWARLLSRITQLQEEDGSWPTEDGDHLKIRNINSVLASLKNIED